ncbi:MAG: TonB-dependent receptor, partial [bacterium]
MFRFRFSSVLLLMSLFYQSHFIFSQPSAKDSTVTLDCKNQPLRTVLEEVTKQTDAKFVYNDAIVDGKMVTCRFQKLSLEKALQKITERCALSYKIQPDKWIVIYEKKLDGAQINSIHGRVMDESSKAYLMGADVFLTGTYIGTSTDEDGGFVISNIPSGSYDLECRYIGYETETIRNIAVTEKIDVQYDLRMKMKPLKMKQITVTPSHFGIMGWTPGVRQTLTRNDIETIPQFGDDIYWAVRRLPGLSANDFSARFNVRGGGHDQILVLMDGLELYEPFHMKYIYGGALSIIDAAAIGGIDLMAGAFTAEYGDRLSGVFNIESKRVQPNDKNFSMGMSFMNARFLAQGSLSGDKGSWLVSVRRGYFDLIMKLIGAKEDIPLPYYYDVLGKWQYRLSNKHTLSVNVLHANDRISLVDDNGAKVDNGYGNSYIWLRLQSVLHPRMFVQTVVAMGRVEQKRMTLGRYDKTQDLFYSVSDERDFQSYDLKQDWDLEVSDRHALKWGFDYKQLDTYYDYLSVPQNHIYNDHNRSNYGFSTNEVVIGPSGHKTGAYFSYRFGIGRPLTVETGFRYDRISYTDERLTSPRLNIVYALGKRTYIRGGWGHFYQSQGIHELYVQDGERAFSQAEYAEHSVIGVEHFLKNGIQLRLESYYKKLSHLHPDYMNWQQSIDLFPEMLSDRCQIYYDGSTAAGIEFYAKKEYGVKFACWASYTLSVVRDRISRIVVDEREKQYQQELPGIFDQRHTFYLDVKYRPTLEWQFNVAWQFHTGYPYTDLVFSQLQSKNTEMGAYNDSRFPPYHRLDVRINRHFITARGSVTVFLEIVNVYNHKNVAYYDYSTAFDPNGRPQNVIVKRARHWFTLLP